MDEQRAESEKWLDAQIDAASELVQVGGQALRQKRTQQGAQALNEAEAILEMAEFENERLLQMRARVFNELGVVHQRQNDLEISRDYHGQAAQICDDLIDSGRDIAANSAATHLNLSSIQLALGERDEARRCGEKALRLIAEHEAAQEDEEPPNPLGLGARQNLAVIYAQSGDCDDASEVMSQARECAEALVEAGSPNYLVQFAQGCQQLSVILFDAERFDDALHWGRQAEEMSERAYQVMGEPVLPVYIISQINLISYNEKRGEFADAEDCLWKAIDVAGNDPRILQRGVAFYETCRKQADIRLKKGNLPRQEVNDGYEELMERVEAAGGIEAVREMANEIRQQRGASRR